MGDEKKSYSSQAIDLDLRIQDAELIENYTDLRVYQLAFESAVHIFELSKKWPAKKNIHSPIKFAGALVLFVPILQKLGESAVTLRIL